MTAFMVTLSIFFTGGMGAAAAAESQQATSALTKCSTLPLKEKLSCLKKLLHDAKISARLVVLFIAEHEWHKETKSRLPELYKKSQKLKKLAQAAVDHKITAEDLKDPHIAKAVAGEKAAIKALDSYFNVFYEAAPLMVQLVKAEVDLMVGLAPIVDSTAKTLKDPELKHAFDEMNAGFGQMNHALTGLNVASAQINRGLNQMNHGLNEMNHGLGQMNEGLDLINEAVDGANRGISKANSGVAGMNRAIDDLNKSLKSGALSKDGSPFKDLDLSGIDEYIHGGPLPVESKAKQAITSAIVNFVPVVGDAKGIVEALTGEDSVTGEKLSPVDRALGAVIFLRWVKAGKSVITAGDLAKAVKNEKAFNRVGSVRWGAGGGGKTALGDSYKTPITEDLRKIVNPGNGKTNCRACVLGVERTLDGTPASALPKLRGGNYKVLEKYFPGKKFVKRSLSNIVKDVKKAGDGARGIVYGGNPDLAHVFNVINRDGDVIFLDAQVGRASPKGYKIYRFMRTK
ncbi:pre-toxin TG domain-containing protein [Streptomyces halobius]|uniref:Pre-toxin TG domain-containing protein n=1 Tax=Streptomyces halobius TaxID=2879846 RepID=A0ABY4MCV6_9ACTN|nr:pre-toxin TG domain-containing protein [Streptomyces halobius]UQA95616.1 pre-toxin TG domain-containing protein [Streptomyces halobius]